MSDDNAKGTMDTSVSTAEKKVMSPHQSASSVVHSERTSSTPPLAPSLFGSQRRMMISTTSATASAPGSEYPVPLACPYSPLQQQQRQQECEQQHPHGMMAMEAFTKYAAMQNSPIRSPGGTTASTKKSQQRGRKPSPEEEAWILSQAVSQAMVAAKSMLLSGASESTAFDTAKAAAASILLRNGETNQKDSENNNNKNSNSSTVTPEDPQSNNKNNNPNNFINAVAMMKLAVPYFNRRKVKDKAAVVASIALAAARGTIAQQQGNNAHDIAGVDHPFQQQFGRSMQRDLFPSPSPLSNSYSFSNLHNRNMDNTNSWFGPPHPSHVIAHQPSASPIVSGGDSIPNNMLTTLMMSPEQQESTSSVFRQNPNQPPSTVNIGRQTTVSTTDDAPSTLAGGASSTTGDGANKKSKESESSVTDSAQSGANNHEDRGTSDRYSCRAIAKVMETPSTPVRNRRERSAAVARLLLPLDDKSAQRTKTPTSLPDKRSGSQVQGDTHTMITGDSSADDLHSFSSDASNIIVKNIHEGIKHPHDTEYGTFSLDPLAVLIKAITCGTCGTNENENVMRDDEDEEDDDDDIRSSRNRNRSNNWRSIGGSVGDSKKIDQNLDPSHRTRMRSEATISTTATGRDTQNDKPYIKLTYEQRNKTEKYWKSPSNKIGHVGNRDESHQNTQERRDDNVQGQSHVTIHYRREGIHDAQEKEIPNDQVNQQRSKSHVRKSSLDGSTRNTKHGHIRKSSLDGSTRNTKDGHVWKSSLDGSIYHSINSNGSSRAKQIDSESAGMIMAHGGNTNQRHPSDILATEQQQRQQEQERPPFHQEQHNRQESHQPIQQQQQEEHDQHHTKHQQNTTTDLVNSAGPKNSRIKQSVEKLVLRALASSESRTTSLTGGTGSILSPISSPHFAPNSAVDVGVPTSTNLTIDTLITQQQHQLGEAVPYHSPGHLELTGNGAGHVHDSSRSSAAEKSPHNHLGGVAGKVVGSIGPRLRWRRVSRRSNENKNKKTGTVPME